MSLLVGTVGGRGYFKELPKCQNGEKSHHGWSTLSRSWLGIFHMVGVVSYKIFAMVVAIRKRITEKQFVGDQPDMDIGKAADALEI